MTEQLNFGEPVQFKNGSTVSVMNISFTSKVSLLNDEKSRRSYLEDEELADVDVRDFVKLMAPNSDQKFNVTSSEREALNEPSADSNAMNITSTGEDEREPNSTTESHDSRHRSRRIPFKQTLNNPQTGTFTLFEKKVIGINMKVQVTVRIESIKKLYYLELDKTKLDLTLQLGGRARVTFLRDSIDTTKKNTKRINGGNIKVVSI